MKLLQVGVILIAIVQTNAEWYKFPFQAFDGARDMLRAYTDMRKANVKNSDKFFHARGNREAADRGGGGVWAAEVISNGREKYKEIRHRFFGGPPIDPGDQAANRFGREGGNPNDLIPTGLPEKYWYKNT